MSAQRRLYAWYRRTRARPQGRRAAEVGAPARHRGIARVHRELRALGVTEPLRFVWSGDGSGVDPDEPAVIHIHRELADASEVPPAVRALAERVLSLDVASVARHEVGHALLFARPRDARGATFRRLFGDVGVAYRVGDPVAEIERRIERHGGLGNPRYRRMVSLYAATHPHERFAEAVRIVLACGANEPALADWVARHRLDGRVLDQLRWAAQWLRSYDRGSTSG